MMPTENDVDLGHQTQKPTRNVSKDTKDRLCDWFSTKLTHAAGLTVTSFDIPSANGYSASTYLLGLRWTESGKQVNKTYVVRQEATEKQLFLESDFVGTAKVQQALGDLGALAVPRVYWIEEDEAVLGTPFCVMEFVDGQIPPDNPPFTQSGWFVDASASDRTEMWSSAVRFLSDLHKIDWTELSVAALHKGPAGTPQIAADLDYYERYYIWATEGNETPTGVRALSWLKDNLPQSERLVVSWGDARPGNMIFKDNRLAGAIDWEMVSLGDPTKDVAYFNYLHRYYTEGMGMPDLEGCLSGSDLIYAYEKESGTQLTDFTFYEAFAAFRSLVIFTRHLNILRAEGSEVAGMTEELNPSAMILNAIIESAG